jgi:hypothetical protein
MNSLRFHVLRITAPEYAIRKVHENQVGLKLNGTHQLLAYADDAKLLGDKNVNDVDKEVGPPRPGFESRSDLMIFVVDRAPLAKDFSMYFDFPCHYFFIMIAPETSLPSTSQA